MSHKSPVGSVISAPQGLTFAWSESESPSKTSGGRPHAGRVWLDELDNVEELHHTQVARVTATWEEVLEDKRYLMYELLVDDKVKVIAEENLWDWYNDSSVDNITLCDLKE